MPASPRQGTRALVVVVALAAAAMLTGLAAQGPGAAGQGGGGRGGQRGAGRGAGPARDFAGQLAADGTAIVAGVVTLSGSGTPVRRAQVSLSTTGGRGGRTTVTDQEGRFSFVSLPAGRYTLTVTKPGYATISYGAKKPGRQGTPIQLADGQTLTNANISLSRGGVITGIVVDEFGEPSPNTQVRAFRYAFQNGERTLQQSGQGQTDDRGMYRIFQLLPGEYVVSAVPRNSAVFELGTQIQAQIQPLLDQLQTPGGATMIFSGGAAATVDAGRGQILDQIQQLRQQIGQQPEQTTAYAPVYYPGTTTPAQAGRVPIEAGQERSGVDFQLQLVPTAKIQGRVTGAEAVGPGAQLMLQPARQQDELDVPGLSRSMARLGPDGTFTFQNVTPGDYRLTVRVPVRQDGANEDPNAQAGPAGPGRGGRGFPFPGRGGPGSVSQVLWASTDVAVDGRDVSDLTLTLQPGMTFSGRFAFDSSASQPPADLSASRVMLLPADRDAIGGVMSQTVDATGNFTVTGVVPGRYTLRAVLSNAGRGGIGAPQPGQVNTGSNWTLKSALLNGTDVLDFGLNIEPNQSPSGMLLTFSDRAQELTGTLQDAMGRPTPDYTIVMFPADNRFWIPQSRRILSTRPGTDGTFSFRGFPAGQYRLTAVTDAEPGEWFDPAFLAQVVPASVMVSVGEGEKKVQDLRLAGQ